VNKQQGKGEKQNPGTCKLSWHWLCNHGIGLQFTTPLSHRGKALLHLQATDNQQSMSITSVQKQMHVSPWNNQRTLKSTRSFTAITRTSEVPAHLPLVYLLS